MDVIVKTVVVDASVVVKVCLQDEEAAEQAQALMLDHAQGVLRLLAPTLIEYEIANALRSAVLKGRLDTQQCLEAWRDIQQFDIGLYDFHDLQPLALQRALQHGRTVYDSAYLALAASQNRWFYTGDRRLFNALGIQLPWLRWIGDYAWDAIPTG